MSTESYDIWNVTFSFPICIGAHRVVTDIPPTKKKQKKTKQQQQKQKTKKTKKQKIKKK